MTDIIRTDSYQRQTFLIYFLDPYTSTKSPIHGTHEDKNPIYPQVNSVHVQKNPRYPPKSPIPLQKNPIYPQKNPIQTLINYLTTFVRYQTVVNVL